MARPTTAVRLPAPPSTGAPDGGFLPRPQRGPAPDPEVGPRLRRGRRPPRRPTSGTSGRRPRGPSSRRPPRSASTRGSSAPTRSPTPPASRCRSSARRCAGVTPASRWRSSGRRSASPASSATARPSRSRSGCRSASARRRRSQLGAFCVSEPDAGSDVSSLRTRAVYDEAKDEWVLNGTKTWITNGGIADVHVVVASVEPELRARGQASFVVPPGTPGLSQGQKFKKHGIRASHTAEVVLDDVRVPGRCLLGGKEKLDARLARAREGQSSRRAGRDEHVRGDPPARRRAGDRHRACRVRVRARLRQGARAVRPADHREPGASRSSSPT